MSLETLDTYIYACIAVCVVGALLNIAMYKRRGVSALLLASAFVLLGGCLEMYRAHAPQPLIVIGGVGVWALLMVDLYLKAKKQKVRR